MENKNLNDIVIEDADSSKKAQFKNILTLLALLFIILVISIVITKLILGNDDENSDLNYIKTESTVEGTSETNTSNASTLAVAGVAAAGAALATTAALSSSETKAPVLTERNTSSRKKLSLRDHRSSDDEAEKKPTTIKKTYTRPKYVAPKERTHVKKRYTSSAPAARIRIKASRGYYIKVGTFKDTTTAIGKIKELKLNYKEIKTKEGATRVLIGPFYSRKDAQNHLSKAKASISPDAYITKIK